MEDKKKQLIRRINHNFAMSNAERIVEIDVKDLGCGVLDLSKCTIWYLCDAEKNKGCRKNSCIHNTTARFPRCEMTGDATCAKLDEAGRPIILEVRQRREPTPIYGECSRQDP